MGSSTAHESAEFVPSLFFIPDLFSHAAGQIWVVYPTVVGRELHDGESGPAGGAFGIVGIRAPRFPVPHHIGQVTMHRIRVQRNVAHVLGTWDMWNSCSRHSLQKMCLQCVTTGAHAVVRQIGHCCMSFSTVQSVFIACLANDECELSLRLYL